jgi:hypothetical protein
MCVGKEKRCLPRRKVGAFLFLKEISAEVPGSPITVDGIEPIVTLKYYEKRYIILY